MRNVTREEFEKFIAEHGEKLERDVYGAAEPPLVTYNDFSMAPKWPESVVASTFLYSDQPGHYYQVSMPEGLLCPNCGAPIHSKLCVCDYCGGWVEWFLGDNKEHLLYG